MSKNTLLLILFILGITMKIDAQDHDSNLARFTVLIPKDGMQRQFEDGYKRHLQWHIDNGDTWNWYGWTIASGKRLGYFVDATFGRSWADFDKPVNPAKDSADLDINVRPFAKAYTQFVCAFLPEFSRGTNADLSAALPQIISFKINPGQELAFEKFLAGFHKEWQKNEPEQNYLWYRIEDGEDVPQYLLFLPHWNFTEKRKTENFLAKLWKQNPSLQSVFQTSVAEISGETMRYRADMTYIPK